MFSICAPHTPEGGEELEAGGEGAGGRQGKALPHRPFELRAQFGVTPTKWLVHTSRAWELLHRGWRGAGGCRCALHRVRGTCGHPEEPLQCSPAPVKGCCSPSPLHPVFGYVGSNRGMEQAPHSARGSRPSSPVGSQPDTETFLRNSHLLQFPLSSLFGSPQKVLCCRSFHPRNRCRAPVIEAHFGDAAEHLLLSNLSHGDSSYPSSVGCLGKGQKAPLVPANGFRGQVDVTRLPLLDAQPQSTSFCKHLGHSEATGPQPSSSSHPPRTLSLSPFPARAPLIEDSLSCQPLVSQHACES